MTAGRIPVIRGTAYRVVRHLPDKNISSPFDKVVLSVNNMVRPGESGKGSGRRTMEKCGICRKDVSEQPSVTDEGTCNMCGAKLTMSGSGMKR